MSAPKKMKRKTWDSVVIEGEIRPAASGRVPVDRDPNLHDIDVVVSSVIAADGKWVLVDRNLVDGGISSTARYVALTRRGFDVSSRHVNGIRNVWARWRHDLPVVSVAAFTTDGQNPDFGID